jgi:uncharacterized repeat protein (TIGR01451 family)
MASRTTDLSASLTATPFITRGEAINLTLKVNNAGPNDASVVSVRVELGAGLNVASVFLSGGTSTPTPDALGTCVLAGNILSCQLPQLPSGGSFTFNITSSATTTTGSFGHIAIVSGNDTDLVLSNNSASAATTVSAQSVDTATFERADGGGGSTSVVLLGLLMLLSCLRAAGNKFGRATRRPLF